MNTCSCTKHIGSGSTRVGYQPTLVAGWVACPEVPTKCQHSSHQNVHGTIYGSRVDAYGAICREPCAAYNHGVVPSPPPLPPVSNDDDLQEVIDEQLTASSKRSIEDLIDEYGRIRGDLSEEYAREQLVKILERKQEFVQDAADAYTDKAEALDYALRRVDILAQEMHNLVRVYKARSVMTNQPNESMMFEDIRAQLQAVLRNHELRVANDQTT